jgi:plasmid stabilization system protein ParE
MKRKVEVAPQARRVLASIILWYRENLGARAALKVAQTIQSRLSAMEAGRVRGAELGPESRYKRVVARKHVILFCERGDILEVVRIIHGSQDLEAIAADLKS